MFNSPCFERDGKHYVCAGDMFRAYDEETEAEYWFERHGAWYLGREPHARLMAHLPVPRSNPYKKWWHEACELRRQEREARDRAFLRSYKREV